MPYDDIYQRVVDTYKRIGSVKQTAQEVGTTLVRAQRILITEGLWSSPTSEKVVQLYNAGKSVNEIADELFVSVKTVQAYLPYSRSEKGYGGNDRSGDAIKSEDYRTRMHQAAEAMVSRERMDKERKQMEEKLPIGNLNIISESETKKAGKKKDKEIAKASKGIDYASLTAADLYNRQMTKVPEVLKLRLTLDTTFVHPEEMEILKKYSKVNEGITRDVLVPADITLHALHYVIQRAFGWQNSHLHQFKLPGDDFQLLTGGKNKTDFRGYVPYDGLYTDWMKLCGIYFRFPCDDFEDLYWDDDYDEDQSFKTWLRKKYTGPYEYGGEWEHYHRANAAAKDMMKKYPQVQKAVSFAEWSEMSETQRKSNKRTYIPIQESTIENIQYGFEGRMDELLERLQLIELLLPLGIKKFDDLPQMVAKLQCRQSDSLVELPVIPIADHLDYAYDYGDGWEVKIEMTDCYYLKDRFDVAKENNLNGAIAIPVTDEQIRRDMTAYDMHNVPQDADFSYTIACVSGKEKPVCIALDGMPVMDDVGGIHGYIDFLETIHGDNPQEKEESREWAKFMGWTGRMNKPETVL